MGSIRELVRKDGVRSYHAEVRLRGHSPQRASFRTKSLAKKWIQDVESAIRDGRHFKTTEARRRTVGDMIDRFVDQWLPRFPGRQKKQTALLSWWKDWYGHLFLADFAPSMIVEGRDTLLSETTNRGQLRSPSTVNRYFSAIGKALSVAEKEWGWIDINPARKVTRCAEGPARERFLSPGEKACLLDEYERSRNPNLLPMVKISLLTGMRLGELTGLRWADVDLHFKKITLWRTKNGDNRVLPLTAEVEEILRFCPAFGNGPDALVFQSGCLGLSGKVASVRESFEAALKRAGIEGFRWHDLRHTSASYLAMNGATQGELMAILGHRSPAMTRRYSHYSEKHLGGVLERAGRVLLGEQES